MEAMSSYTEQIVKKSMQRLFVFMELQVKGTNAPLLRRSAAQSLELH